MKLSFTMFWRCSPRSSAVLALVGLTHLATPSLAQTPTEPTTASAADWTLDGEWVVFGGPEPVGLLQIEAEAAAFRAFPGEGEPALSGTATLAEGTDAHRLYRNLGRVLFLDANTFWWWDFHEAARVARAFRRDEAPDWLLAAGSQHQLDGTALGEAEITGSTLMLSDDGGAAVFFAVSANEASAVVATVTGARELRFLNLDQLGVLMWWNDTGDASVLGHTPYDGATVMPPPNSRPNLFDECGDPTHEDEAAAFSSLQGTWLGTVGGRVRGQFHFDATGQLELIALDGVDRIALPLQATCLRPDYMRFQASLGEQTLGVHVAGFATSPDAIVIWNEPDLDLMEARRVGPVPDALSGEWLLQTPNDEAITVVTIGGNYATLARIEDIAEGRVWVAPTEGGYDLVISTHAAWYALRSLGSGLFLSTASAEERGYVWFRAEARPPWL